MSGFQVLGILIFVYTLYAALTGEVYAKDKWSSRTIHKTEEPKYFRAVIACYILLSIACIFLF